MKKKTIIIPAVIIIVLLLGGLGYTLVNLHKQKQANNDLQQLASLDKKEMENEYSQFALQYDELKHSIKNDSLMDQLNKEQKHTENLLAELKRVKSDDAKEITRLKKELATVRAVLRSYILQVDSLQRVNSALVDENAHVKAQYTEATAQITSLNTEKAGLAEKVAIASQLDATGISVSAQNKRGKNAKKIKDVTRFVVHFTITKNCRNRNTILHCITFSTNSACIIFTFHIAKTVTVCYCTCTVTGYSSGIVTRLRLYCSITLASIYKSKFL